MLDPNKFENEQQEVDDAYYTLSVMQSLDKTIELWEDEELSMEEMLHHLEELVVVATGESDYKDFLYNLNMNPNKYRIQ